MYFRVRGNYGRSPGGGLRLLIGSCTTGTVKGCKMPAPSRRPDSLHENSTGRRLTSLEGGNRGTMPRSHGRQ